MDNFSRCISGHELYGDDFGLDEIKRWYDEEKKQYFKLSDKISHRDTYGYHSLNEFHFFKALENKSFSTCLAIG